MNTLKVFTLAIVLSSVIITSFSFSFKNETVKVGHVENARMLTEYNAIKEMKVEYESKVKNWRGELDSLKVSIDSDITEFKSSFHNMSEEQKKYNSAVIRQKKEQLEVLASEIEERIGNEDQRVSTSILKQIDSYIQQYGSENGFDYIMGVTDAGNVLFAKNSHDLTDEILIGLNNKYDGL